MAVTAKVTIVLLSLCVLSVDAIRSVPAVTGDAPDFCHNADCPKFTTKEEHDEYEIREYEEANWVGTKVEGHRFEIAVTMGSTKVYRYFDGDNLDKQKLNTTTPVVTQFYPSEGFRTVDKNFTVAFFLPFDYQEDPPKPRDRLIVTHASPASDMYVRSFGGFATQQGVLAEAAKLQEAVKEDGHDVLTEWFYLASYDPPYRVTGRHNEVWMLPKTDAASVSES